MLLCGFCGRAGGCRSWDTPDSLLNSSSDVHSTVPTMLRSTFQLTRGLGPGREKRFWDAGVTSWDALPSALPAGISAAVGDRLRRAVAEASVALAAHDADRLATFLPAREHWRMFAAFEEDALYLDIETDFEGVTAIGLLDRNGPRIFLRDRDLDAFPSAARGHALVVTFNGLSFDLPILRSLFPSWRPPAAHIDLRHVWARLGYHGGLKHIERELGIGRPPHLDGIDGNAAVNLWRHHVLGSKEGLRLFAEYNLYDTVNLRTLAALAYNEMVAATGRLAPAIPVSYRGDVLYDVSRVLLAL
jgi:uncharacterized protein